MEYSPDRPEPVIFAVADGNREVDNAFAGNRFSLVTSEYGWDVSYLTTYHLSQITPGGQYILEPKQDAMITPEWSTRLNPGGYRSSYFGISSETGEGIVIGCQQYLQRSRDWNLFACFIDADVLDENYFSGNQNAYILRDQGQCSFEFIPPDNQYQGVGYPSDASICRRGNTAGELIESQGETLAYIAAGTCYSNPGGVGNIPANTPGGIYIASRGFPSSDQLNRGEAEAPQTGMRPVESELLENPVRESVRLSLVLEESSDVDLFLYDLGGHLVLTRSLGGLSEGTHLLEWDMAGESLPGGAYLVSLATGTGTSSHRILLLR